MKVRKKKIVRKPSHKKKKSNEKLKKVLGWIKTILVAALFLTTAVYTALSPFFNITKIEAVASTNYDSLTLIKASGVQAGVNGFRQVFTEPGKFYFLRIGSAEKAIQEACPHIKSTRVKYVIPSTAVIEVTEREPSALLSLTGRNLLIDGEGYLLEIDPENVDDALPVIKGIEISTYKPGQKLDIDQNLLLSAFEVFDTIKETDEKNTDKLLPAIDYVDVRDLSNIVFSLESRVIVKLGEADDLNYKINAVRTIFTGNITNKARGTLDFSVNRNPVFTPENGG